MEPGPSLLDETEFTLDGAPAAEPLGDAPVAAPAAPRKKILTCDDEKNIVRLIQVNLERQGYEVMTAYNGRECLEKVAQERPDLIVLDLMMPEMTGFEALDKLKSNPETADIPVIMLTARTQDQDVLRGWQSGVECYLTKPFKPTELLTFVNRIFAVQDNPETSDDGDNRLEL